MGMYIELHLAESDEAQNMSYAVRSQMVELDAVQAEDEAEEGMNRRGDPPHQVMGEQDALVGAWERGYLRDWNPPGTALLARNETNASQMTQLSSSDRGASQRQAALP